MINVKEILLSTQVTAVKVKKNTVFIGEGQYLHIHSLLTGKRLAGTRVFQAAAVHGIKIQVCLEDSADDWRVLVWGQKSFSVVAFKPLDNLCWQIVKEKTVEDWVIDAAWEDLSHVVVATAHNSLLQIKLPREEPTEDHMVHRRGFQILSNHCQPGECEIAAREQCCENCILYCGHIVIDGGRWDGAVLLAGTVFSQVLIWGPWGERNHGGRVIPSHYLSGHQGVLFSVNFCSISDVITTTSDDRSMSVWSIQRNQHENYSLMHNCENPSEREVKVQCDYWKSCCITKIYKCFGHGSRVWRSLILPSCYVSVGEDSKVCVWDRCGMLLTSWKAHDGACIWSVAASDDASRLVTGGGDGSVKSWCYLSDLPQNPEVIAELPWVGSDNLRPVAHVGESSRISDMIDEQIQEIVSQNDHSVECDSDGDISTGSSDAELFSFGTVAKTNKDTDRKNITKAREDFPRCVSLLGLSTYLVMMDSGKLYSWDPEVSTWNLVFEDEKLKSYTLMESSPEQDSLALGTLCGHIIILAMDGFDQNMKVVAEEKVIKGKVFALLWLSSEQLLVCGNEGAMMTLDVDISKGKLQKGNHHILPPCRQRWVSAACLFAMPGKDHLVCGDRAGGIHLYSQLPEAHHSLRSIHGRNGVTGVTHYHGYIYSTGRDGCIRCLTVQDNILQVVTVTRVSNVNWVAALIYLSGRQLAVCFHDIKLKLWSMEEDRAVVDIECGGGHRSWAMQSSEADDKLSFIYIKDTKPYTFSTTLKDKLMPLIKTPVNTRETMCLQRLFQVNDTTIFTSGGEDTTFRLHTVTEGKLNTLNVIRSHISNIRTLCRIDYSTETSVTACKKETVWMVSAGGRAQMKIWKAMLIFSSDNEKIKIPDVGCREVTSHMLRTGSPKTWKSQEMTFDPETRYMDATAFWVTEMKALIVLASSDGFLRFFEFNSHQEKIKLLYSQVWNQCLLRVEKIHLDNRCILISAATDGSLVFWNIQPLVDWIRHENNSHTVVPEPVQVTSIKAHQSGVNCIAVGTIMKTDPNSCICNFMIASGGDDNKIGIWKMTVNVTNSGKSEFSIGHVCDAYGHASQITGLNWLAENHLLSTSIDQRVIFWKLQQGGNNCKSTQNVDSFCNETTQAEGARNSDRKDDLTPFRMEPVSSHFLGVADVKGLTVVNLTPSLTHDSALLPHENSVISKRIFIYGVGLQVYDIDINGT